MMGGFIGMAMAIRENHLHYRRVGTGIRVIAMEAPQITLEDDDDTAMEASSKAAERGAIAAIEADAGDWIYADICR